MYRSKTYNEASWFHVVPLHRFDVVPGHSVDLNVKVKVRSAPFKRLLLSGGQMIVASFYTPYRLLWDGWVDFVSERDGNGVTVNEDAAVPQLNGNPAWPFVFENAVNGRNPFGRRAYKLLYNEFFGSTDWGQNYNVTDDSAIGRFRSRTLDQFLSSVMETADVYEQTTTFPVTGTAPNQVATVTLNELRRLMSMAKSQRRFDLTGDKYVDAMMHMGVKLDWRVQLAPELLSLTRKEYEPRVLTATNIVDQATAGNSETLGQAACFVETNCDHSTGKRYFAEHGVIWTVAVLKPHVWWEEDEGTLFARPRLWKEFFMGESFGDLVDYDPSAFGTVAALANVRAPRFTSYAKGHNIMGDRGDSPWVFSQEAEQANASDLVYPAPSRGMVTDTGLTYPIAFLSDVSLGQASPIPPIKRNT